MAPFYRGFQNMISLDRDDVTAVQALYGASDQNDQRDNEVRDTPRSGKSLVGDNRLLCLASANIQEALWPTPTSQCLAATLILTTQVCIFK